MTITVDIGTDWNVEDETGLPWTFVDRALTLSKIVPGEYVIAGRGTAVAVAEVVDKEGVVHLRPLPGLVSSHTHLLSASA